MTIKWISKVNPKLLFLKTIESKVLTFEDILPKEFEDTRIPEAT